MNAAPNLPAGSDERITQRLEDGMARHGRGQRLRRRAVALTAAAAVIVSAGGFAWVTIANQTLQTRSAYCYSSDSTNSRYTQVGLPDQMTGPDATASPVSTPSDRTANAIDMCGSAWRAGVLGSKTAPTLVACVRTDNVPAVFPKADDDQRDDAAFCDALSLAPGR